MPCGSILTHRIAAFGRFLDLKYFFFIRFRRRRLLVNNFLISVTLPSLRRARMMTPVELVNVSIQYKMLEEKKA